MTTGTTPQNPAETPVESLPEAVASLAKDALYVTVGFGVLAVQKANVQRHELAKRFPNLPSVSLPKLPEAPDSAELRARVRDQVHALDLRVREVEQRLDTWLDEVQGRLPAQAADLFGQVRHAGKAYEARVRELARVPA